MGEVVWFYAKNKASLLFLWNKVDWKELANMETQKKDKGLTLTANQNCESIKQYS
jgi:hypothetical protein